MRKSSVPNTPYFQVITVRSHFVGIDRRSELTETVSIAWIIKGNKVQMGGYAHLTNAKLTLKSRLMEHANR